MTRSLPPDGNCNMSARRAFAEIYYGAKMRTHLPPHPLVMLCIGRPEGPPFDGRCNISACQGLCGALLCGKNAGSRAFREHLVAKADDAEPTRLQSPLRAFCLESNCSPPCFQKHFWRGLIYTLPRRGESRGGRSRFDSMVFGSAPQAELWTRPRRRSGWLGLRRGGTA